MPAIQGLLLAILTVAVSLGIFMNVLDTSIANVAIPTIAGNLGVSADQGTWVITSFAVSTAITLPLTGWLAKRCGEVRLFVGSTLLFTLVSLLCGLSTNFPMLVMLRVLQGMVAGPMIPLSQSLLLENYPEEKKGFATAIWAMVAVAAPVAGPILGGYITDNYHWPWIFYINLPIGLFSALATWMILHERETPISRSPVDYVGIILLAVGIGSLQILLDRGRNLDWFNSPTIIALGVSAIMALSFFVVWELTEADPIVDLTLFKSRNFTIGTITLSLGYMVFFGSVVVLPLWLQTQQGYTATLAGLATAPLGILPFILSPLLGQVIHKFDQRWVVSFGFLVFLLCCFWLAASNTNITFAEIAWIRFIQGIGAPCFFIATTIILLSGLPNRRLASAAGLSTFLRILGGSFGTSISVNLWDNRASIHQSQLVEPLIPHSLPLQQTLAHLTSKGFVAKQPLALVLNWVEQQAFMLATNDVFLISGFLFAILLGLIWLARPPFIGSHKVSIAE